MRDQVQQLQTRGIAAAELNSSNSGEDNAVVEAGLRRGRYRLVYVSPERLARPDMPAIFRAAGANVLAIDEAHCVSQWGHDFRPDYLGLAQAAQAIGNLQLIAVTATADASTRTEIIERLFPAPPRVFVSSFDRPNIRLAFQRRVDGSQQIETMLQRHKGESGIIYCATRKGTEKLAQTLAAMGVPTLAYHAGLDAQLRSNHEEEFLRQDGMIMVATIAFGMGIDKPNIRFVCHADLPHSIEAHYHETGRAGRDGLPAETLTLFSEADIRQRAQKISLSDVPPDRKRIERQKLESLIALCETSRCRRQTLLAAFGEASKACGNCDNCNRKWSPFKRLGAERVASTIHRISRRFLALDARFEPAPAKELGVEQATYEPPKAEFPTLQLTATQNRLFAALRAKRLEIARRQKQAPVLIFDDGVLIEMAIGVPETRDDLLAIPGVGHERVERYGAIFLAVIADHSEAP
jgi:ATP-dependent DNA helicase RecQ